MSWPPTLLRVMVLLLVAAGCSDGRVRPTAGEILVTSEAPIRFPPALVGESSEAMLRLSNSSRFERRVVLSTAAPFSVESEWVLAGGEERGMPLRFAPSSVGTFEGTVVIEVEGVAISVALVAEGRRGPGCEPSSPCVRSVWSNEVGACIEEPVEDGTSCTAACLADATCQKGACVGTPRSCDDGNLCTADVCDPFTGCAHTPRICDVPPPCMASVCDPEVGCALAPAPDGTACGRRGCDVQDICIAGSCVARVPPEGASCGFESPCQPLGTCRANECLRLPAVSLDPAWSLIASDAQSFRVFGLADADGNPLLGRQTRALAEILSFTPSGAPRFGIVGEGHEWPVLVAGPRIISRCDDSAFNTEVCARRATDGSLLWQSELRRELGRYFSPSPAELEVMVPAAFWTAGRLKVVVHSVRREGPGTGFRPIDGFMVELDPSTGKVSAWARISPEEYTRIANEQGATFADSLGAPADSKLLARDGAGALLWERPVVPGHTAALLAAPDGTLVIRTQLENVHTKAVLTLLDGTTGATRAETGLVTQTFVSLTVANRESLFTWAFDGNRPFLARIELATAGVTFRKYFGHPEMGTSSPFSLTLTSKDTLLFVVTANDVPYLAEWGLDGEERFLCRVNAPIPWGKFPKILVTQGHAILYGDWPMDEVHAFPLPGYDTAKNAWATEAANLQGTNSF